MAERIPNDILNEIGQSIDIVDVVSEYVQLKNRAAILASVHSTMKRHLLLGSPDKQIYYCFGCQRR